jgi:hypothetical protein
MYIRITMGLAGLCVLVGLSCERALEATIPPAQVTTAPSYCATDFSCPIGQECINGSCAPIRPALRPHIQTASALLRAELDAAEITWRASHYDLLIGNPQPNEARAANPNVRIFEYSLIRFHRFDTGPKTASQWAAAHGYNGEDFYLHYKEDTMVPTWEGKTIVPGFPAGMAPGWNPGGGGNPASATSRAQSRVVGFYNGNSQPWHLANLAHPGYKQFLAERIEGLIDGTWWYNQPFASGPLDGIMGDEAIYYAVYNEGVLSRSTEYYGIPITDYHPYAVAIEQYYPYLSQALLDAFGRTADVMPNYGNVMFLNYANPSAINIQAATPWVWGEVWLTNTGYWTPTGGAYRCVTYDKDYVNGVRALILQMRTGGRRVIGARDTANGTAGTDRGKLFTLGLYYMLHSKYSYYMYETAQGHALPGHVSTWAYNPAVDYDIGQPAPIPASAVDFEGMPGTSEHWVFATGPDPHVPSLTYRVLARRFTRALVLAKMLPLGSVDDNRSITTHALGGSYRPLLANGTLGSPVTQASIRNNESLILIPEVVSGVR